VQQQYIAIEVNIKCKSDLTDQIANINGYWSNKSTFDLCWYEQLLHNKKDQKEHCVNVNFEKSMQFD